MVRHCKEEEDRGQKVLRHFVLTAEDIEHEPLGKIGAERLKLGQLRMAGKITPEQARKKDRELERLADGVVKEERQKTLARVAAERARQAAIKSARRKPAIRVSGTVMRNDHRSRHDEQPYDGG